MQTVSYTLARSKLASTMQKVCDDHAPIIVTRMGAKPVVMISLEDYEAMEETQYLVKSPANASRLAMAFDEIEEMINNKKSSNK